MYALSRISPQSKINLYKNAPGARGISLIRKSVRDFSEQKDFDGFLMDFFLKQKDFRQRCTRFLGVNAPRPGAYSRIYSCRISVKFGSLAAEDIRTRNHENQANIDQDLCG